MTWAGKGVFSWQPDWQLLDRCADFSVWGYEDSRQRFSVGETVRYARCESGTGLMIVEQAEIAAVGAWLVGLKTGGKTPLWVWPIPTIEPVEASKSALGVYRGDVILRDGEPCAVCEIEYDKDHGIEGKVRFWTKPQRGPLDVGESDLVTVLVKSAGDKSSGACIA